MPNMPREAEGHPTKDLTQYRSLTTRIRCIMSLNIEEHTMSCKETRHDIVDDYLNEAYDEVTICGCTFTPADILFELDPTAYRCLAADLLAEEDEE